MSSKFTAILLLGRHSERLSGQAVVTVQSSNSSFAKKFKTSIGQIFDKLWTDFKLNSFLPASILRGEFAFRFSVHLNEKLKIWLIHYTFEDLHHTSTKVKKEFKQLEHLQP